MSTLSSRIVMAMVRAIDRVTRASWAMREDRTPSPNCPRYAPGVVMMIFPRNTARENFATLYFRSPRGIMTGSSGIGVADAMNKAGKAHFPIFVFRASKRLLRSSPSRPPRKYVTKYCTSLAEAEPMATSRPNMSGLVSTNSAAFMAMKRFEGPANGIRFRTKEKKRTLSSSMPDTNVSSACFLTGIYGGDSNKPLVDSDGLV
jgi:hypothetical protein